MPGYSSTPSYDPSAPIDLSLFAHIVNEAFASGAYKLEGNRFSRTVSYMGNYFNRLEREGRLPTEFLVLKKNIQFLGDIACRIEEVKSIRDNHSWAEFKFRELVRQIVNDQLLLLTDGEYLSLPGGWSTLKGSHSMIYQFQRTTEGFIFYVFNSGAGLDYHEKKSTSTQELFCPVMAYTIPMPMDSNKLGLFIHDLIYPQLINLHPKEGIHFNDEVLYEQILPRSSYLNAQLISMVAKIPHAFTLPQLSNTCANQCLYKMLFIICKTPEDFERLIYGYQRYALDDLIQVVTRENALHDMAVQNQIRHGIKSMMRTINKPMLFQKEWVEKQYLELKAYRDLLDQTRIIPTRLPVNGMDRYPTIMELYSTDIPDVLRPRIDGAHFSSNLESEITKPIAGGRGLIAQLIELQRTCEQLKKRGQLLAIIHTLELEFSKFPLPSSTEKYRSRLAFYSDVYAYNQLDFYRAVTSLHEMYLAAFNALFGDSVLPRMFVIGLSVLSVLDYISNLFDQTKFSDMNLHDLIAGFMSRIFEGNQNNPYFATNQVVLDQRLIQIKMLYPYSSKYISIIEYYQGIINSEPSLKRDLELNGCFPEDYQFASQLQKKGLKSLYWLTSHFSKLEKDVHYRPLITKFNIQYAIEKVALNAIGGFLGGTVKYKQFKLVFEPTTSSIKTESISYELLWGSHNQILIKHKYGFCKDSPPFHALMIDYPQCLNQQEVRDEQRSDNHVQLFSRIYNQASQKADKEITVHVFNPSQIGDREYYHLRRAKPLQIKLTLDYFIRHVEKLSDTACQIYLEANVFEPGLLLAELSQGEDVLLLFDQLIEVGLHYEGAQGNGSDPSLFFIRLNYLVSRYATEYRPELAYPRLGRLQRQIQSLLQSCMSSETSSLHTLYQYLFLTTIMRYQFAPREISGKELGQYLGLLLPAYFYINAKRNPHSMLDTATQVDIDFAKYEFKKLLTRNGFEEVEPWIGLSMETLGLGVCRSTSQKMANHYVVKMEEARKSIHYSVNVEQGRVFHSNGMSYSVLPLDIVYHPVMNFLKITQFEPCFATKEGLMFEFGEPAVRFIKQNKESLYRVQKKWTINHVTQWYELHTLSYAQERDYQLDTVIIHLSEDKIFHQRDTQIWLNCEEPNHVLITQNHRPAYRSIQLLDKCKLVQLDDQGIDNGFMLCSGSTDIHLRFSSFEDRTFMVVCQRDERLQIQFPRYGFNLVGQQKAGLWTFNLEHHGDFILVGEIDEKIPGVAGLIFENITTRQRECYIPLQRFIVLNEPSPRSEFYKLEHDISAKILFGTSQALMSNADGSFWSWQYSNTETLLRYSLNEEGDPYAETTIEALYLAYLYLGSHNPQKAWNVLDDCTKRLGGLQGIVDELSLIYWIINEMPFDLDKKILDTSITTPAYSACLLKALALLTGYLTPGKSFEFPSQKSNLKAPDDLYQDYLLKVLQKFYNNLNKTLYSMYVNYQNNRHYLDHDFQLNDAEKKSLLDYYHHHLPGQEKKALGALGYEWHALALKQLKREQAALSAERNMRGILPIAYEKRLQDIEQFVKEDSSVRAVSTELECLPIDLSLPENIRIDWHGLQEGAYRNCKAWWEDINIVPMFGYTLERAMKAVVPTITKEQLMEFFPIYVSLIKAPHRQEYKIMIDFCRQFLIANRHVSMEKQDSSLTCFINLLYRILLHPTVFCDERGRFKWVSCEKMIREAQALPQPEINIYQNKIKSHQLLASRAHIWLALNDHGSPDTTPLKPLFPLSMDQYTPEAMIQNTLLHPSVKVYLIDCCIRYKTLSQLFHNASSTPASDDPSHRVLNPREIEAGIQKGRALKKMKQIAFEMLNNALVRKALKKSAGSFIKALHVAKQQKWQAILAQVEEGPLDPIKKRQRQLELESGQIALLDEFRLLSMYCRANKDIYKQETGLGAIQIARLHTLLTHYLGIAIQLQHWQRFSQLMDDDALNPEKSNLQTILGCLLAENLVDTQSEPVLVLFQFYENLLLYPEQIDVCKRLIKSPQSDPSSFVESIEKIPMGGGKSKVILPLLARIKATGSNLVMIEVPRALLKTNFVDLTYASSRLFEQKVHLLEFNRDSDGSIENLEYIHSTLLNTIVNKDYMVTTGETIRSLRLKYSELLLYCPQDETQKSIWVNQVRQLDNIINLLKNRTDVLLDEPHQGLLPKRVLNYTLGECRSLPPEIITECVELFLFFDHFSLEGILEETCLGQSFASLFLTRETRLKPKDKRWDAVKKQLADLFVSRQDSPLQRTCRQMGLELTTEVKDNLVSYLLENTDVTPSFILDSDPKFREIFALYKGQINVLPETLSREFNVDYGASKLPSKDASLAALAIPYVANNDPVEKSRFGNELVSINLTIQMLMIDGLSPDLLSLYLHRLQIQAKQELQKYPMYEKLDNTPTARGLRNLAPDLAIPFSQINEKDEQQFKWVFAKLHQNKHVIADVLKNEVLIHITIESEFLHSNAYHHVDSYRSCQGITGTPGPMSLYHQRFNQIEQKSTAMDGFIYYLLHEKKTPIRHVEKQSVSTVIQGLFATKSAKDNVRAIIDVCAAFKGISNERVSQGLADYIRAYPEIFALPEPLKFIVFFNQDNVLCALDIHQNNKLIVIGSTEPRRLDTLLGCTPNQRFTYYDQSHAEGIDLKQAKTAQALILVDEDTCLQNHFQGCLRLREFQQDQSIEIIMTNQDEILSLEQLCTKMDENQKRTLCEKVFVAGQAKMTNLIRTDLERRILTIPNHDVEKKHRYALAFRKYFVETSKTSLFDKYGRIAIRCKAEDILSEQQRYLLDDWADILETVGEKANAAELGEIRFGLEAIIKDTLSICKGTLQTPTHHALDTEVENQKQLQIELCRETQLEKECFDPDLMPTPYEPWLECPLSAAEAQKLGILSLTELCSIKSMVTVPDFGQLFVTRNYYKTYEEQAKFLGPYLKPIHAILFHQKDDEHLEAFILSQQEANDLVTLLRNNPKSNLWMTTTHLTCLAGKPASRFHENKTYLDMIEKIRFFNGEFSNLLEGKVPLNWLSHDTEKKLLFFEKNLLLYRETKPHDLVILRESLSQRQNAFYYIKEHPLRDYVAFDWRNEISQALTDTDIEECSNLAQSFAKANQNWQVEGVSWKTCQEGLRISMQASTYISDYFEEYILRLKEAFPSFEEDDVGRKLKNKVQKLFPILIEYFIPLWRSKQRTLLQFLLLHASQVQDAKEVLEIAEWLVAKKVDMNALDGEGRSAFDLVLREGGYLRDTVLQWLIERHATPPSKKESWQRLSLGQCLEWLQWKKMNESEPFLLACMEVFERDEATFLNLIRILTFTDTLIHEILKRLPQYDLNANLEQHILLFQKIINNIRTDLSLYEVVLSFMLQFSPRIREYMMIDVNRIPWCVINPQTFECLIQDASPHFRTSILYSPSFHDRLKQNADLLKPLLRCEKEESRSLNVLRHVSFKKELHLDVLCLLIQESKGGEVLHEIFMSYYDKWDESHLKQIIGVYPQNKATPPSELLIILLQQVIRHPKAEQSVLENAVIYALRFHAESMRAFWKGLSYQPWASIDPSLIREMFHLFSDELILNYFQSIAFLSHRETILDQLIELNDFSLYCRLFPYLMRFNDVSSNEKSLSKLLKQLPKNLDKPPHKELIGIFNLMVTQAFIDWSLLNLCIGYALNFEPQWLEDFWHRLSQQKWIMINLDSLCKMFLMLPDGYLSNFLSSPMYLQYSDIIISRLMDSNNPDVLDCLIRKPEFQLHSSHLFLIIKKLDELGNQSLLLTMMAHPSANELVLIAIIEKIDRPTEELRSHLMGLDQFRKSEMLQRIWMEKLSRQFPQEPRAGLPSCMGLFSEQPKPAEVDKKTTTLANAI